MPRSSSRRINRLIGRIAAAVLGGWLFLGAPVMAQDTGELRVEDAWVREPPVATTSAGGYFTLHNDGESPAVLVNVTSPSFVKIKMHRSIKRGGKWMMEPRRSVTVEGGEKVEFKPGDLHLMMREGVQPVQGGQQIELTLQFQDGRELTTVAEVRRDR